MFAPGPFHASPGLTSSRHAESRRAAAAATRRAAPHLRRRGPLAQRPHGGAAGRQTARQPAAGQPLAGPRPRRLHRAGQLAGAGGERLYPGSALPAVLVERPGDRRGPRRDHPADRQAARARARPARGGGAALVPAGRPGERGLPAGRAAAARPAGRRPDRCRARPAPGTTAVRRPDGRAGALPLDVRGPALPGARTHPQAGALRPGLAADPGRRPRRADGTGRPGRQRRAGPGRGPRPGHGALGRPRHRHRPDRLPAARRAGAAELRGGHPLVPAPAAR